MMLKIERTIEIRACRADVWRLFSSQEGLQRWLAPTVEIDVALGGAYRLVGGEDGQIITGAVTEFRPMRAFALSWFEAGPGSDWVNPIRKAFRLEDGPAGTRVSSVIDGFEGIGKPAYQRTYEAYVRGTVRHHILQNLKNAAEADNPAAR